VLAVIFDGHGTELNTNKVTFMAPTTASGNTNPPVNGNNVKLPDLTALATDNKGPENGNVQGKGYVLQSLDTSGVVHKYDKNAFYGFAALPSDGIVDGSNSTTWNLQAFYTDESPMQYRDVTDPLSQGFGIDFSYTGSDGVLHQIPPSTSTGPAYWVPTMTIPI